MKKIIAVLLTAVICVTMAGCGSSVDPNASALETAPPVDSVEPSVLADMPSDETGSAEEDNTQIENDMGITESETDTGDMSSDSGLEGIIVVQCYYHAFEDGQSNVFVYDVNSVNPDDGSAQKIASLQYCQPYTPADAGYYFVSAGIGADSRIGYDRRIFSSDFTKMAITMCGTDKNESHAGWVDSNGEFFDVTDALGEASGDFDPAVNYAAVGFTEDDMFVYNDNVYAQYYQWPDINFFYTDINDLASSQNGNLLQYPVALNNGEVYCMTDWCDETTYIADHYTNSGCTIAKYNTATGAAEELISGEVRTNWSGACSPDGSMIAFLSMPNDGNGNPEIYIMSADGGSPQKVECGLNLSREPACPCSIIGWE